jgi:hypothetical protein
LNTGKHAGKVKGFRVNAETEEKMTNEQRIMLIKGAISHVDVNNKQLTIKKLSDSYQAYGQGGIYGVIQWGGTCQEVWVCGAGGAKRPRARP